MCRWFILFKYKIPEMRQFVYIQIFQIGYKPIVVFAYIGSVTLHLILLYYLKYIKKQLKLSFISFSVYSLKNLNFKFIYFFDFFYV